MPDKRVRPAKPLPGQPFQEGPCALVLEACTDAVVACSDDGTAICLNRAAEKLLGWKREEVLGKNLLHGGFLPIPLLEAWLKSARHAASADAPEAPAEEKAAFTDGSGREQAFSVRLLPLKSQDASFVGFAALLARVEPTQAQYATHLIHETRTPLTSILAAAHILQRSCPDGLPSQGLKQLEIIRRNARALLEITNDFLDLSRLRHGAYSVILQNVDLTDLLAEVADEVEPLYQRKGLSLETGLDKGTPGKVLIDPEAVRRILVNLLSNACKFTEKGGATLRACFKEDQLHFCIRDTGVGLCTQEIKAIFREFSQAGDRETSRRNGSGLGLVIADRYARLLGGRIEVESQPGQGSSFTLIVPLTQVQSAP